MDTMIPPTQYKDNAHFELRCIAAVAPCPAVVAVAVAAAVAIAVLVLEVVAECVVVVEALAAQASVADLVVALVAGKPNRRIAGARLLQTAAAQGCPFP